MSLFSTKRIIAAICLVALGAGLFYILKKEPMPEPVVTVPAASKTEIIGNSVEGRDILATTYGTGTKHLLFVGGIHGGYEWNSVLLAYEMMDYLAEYPAAIPPTLSVTVIPSANPDGLFAVVGKSERFTVADVPATTTLGQGRFNANKVDLNRNFDCKWKPESTWQGRTVSAGTAAFSEPEAKALRDFITKTAPSAVVFWHSKANAVYASECENGILPQTLAVMNAYAKAGGYQAIDSFDAYPVSGDAEGWLASINIPAITVELETRDSIEWERNLAGVKALFNLYAKSTEKHGG